MRNMKKQNIVKPTVRKECGGYEDVTYCMTILTGYIMVIVSNTDTYFHYVN